MINAEKFAFLVCKMRKILQNPHLTAWIFSLYKTNINLIIAKQEMFPGIF
jgi:hypothetical protein